MNNTRGESSSRIDLDVDAMTFFSAIEMNHPISEGNITFKKNSPN
jgi:hypothetical protein